MIFEEKVQHACVQTGIPVTQRPICGDAPKYLTWYELLGRFDGYASDRATRVRHSVSIDLFSRIAPVETDVLEIVNTLKRNGVRPMNWGALTFEQDTGWYHLPITCEVFTEGVTRNG